MSEHDWQLEPDPVVEEYEKHIDRILIREDPRPTVEPRFEIESRFSNLRLKPRVLINGLQQKAGKL